MEAGAAEVGDENECFSEIIWRIVRAGVPLARARASARPMESERDVVDVCAAWGGNHRTLGLLENAGKATFGARLAIGRHVGLRMDSI